MKIKLFQPLYVNAALAFAFLFVSYSVLAQDVSEAAYQPNATTALEEIIVTARKREESLQDAPVAITAFGQQMIEDYQINTFDDLAAMMPSLISSDGTSGPSGGAIFLRGIGNGDANPLNSGSVAINVDGMQVGSMTVRRSGQYDVAQIEVLRGPQALFFGKNSPGGLISLTTADPTDEIEVIATLGYEFESDDNYLELIASGPLSDSVGGRLAIRHSDNNGYFDVRTVPSNGDPLIIAPDIDAFPIGEEKFVRGTLTYDPSDALSMRAKLTYNKGEIDGGTVIASQRFSCPFGNPQGAFGFLPQAVFPCNGTQDSRNIYVGSVSPDLFALDPQAFAKSGVGGREEEIVLASFEVNYDVTDELTFTSITGYFDAQENFAQNASAGPRLTLFVPRSGFEINQLTQEFRLASNYDSSVNFMIGAFYEDKQSSTFSNFGVTSEIAGIFFQAAGVPAFVFPLEQSEEDSETVSIFTQVQWDISETLELSVGLRYSDEEKSLGLFGDLGFGLTDFSANLVRDSLTVTNTSPEITLSYHPQENWLLYGSYKTGFKSGGFDGGFTNGAIFAPGFDNTFNEEKVEGFEFGSKAVLADGTVRLNLALYHYEYEDLQVGTLNPATLSFRVSNAASATLQGLEVDFDWLTTVAGLSVRGAFGYNDSTFNEFFGQCYIGQTPTLGCNRSLNPGTGAFLQQDLSGRNLNQAPELTGTFGFNYKKLVADNIEMAFSMNAAYSDEFYGNAVQAPDDLVDAVTKIHANVTLSSTDGKWEVALLGRNLTDKISFTSTNAATLTGGGSGFEGAFPSDRAGFPTRGREIKLRLTYSFGD